MITQIIEKKSELVAKEYNDVDDMFHDLLVKLELYSCLAIDDEFLSYSLSLYTDDVKVLVKAIQLNTLDNIKS